MRTKVLAIGVLVVVVAVVTAAVGWNFAKDD